MCKTFLLKEMLGHSSSFVLHLHIWQNTMKTEEINTLSSSLLLGSVLSGQCTSIDCSGFCSLLHRFNSELFCVLFNNATNNYLKHKCLFLLVCI